MGDEKACTKEKYVQWSGFAGSVAFGIGGAALVGFGLPLLLVGSAVSGGLIGIGIVSASTMDVSYYAAKAGKWSMSEMGEVLFNEIEGRNKDILVETVEFEGSLIWKSQ
jgi:hypothetical protein